MKHIQLLLSKREQYLKKLIQQMESALQSSPNGFLRVSQSGNRIQYYQRTDPKNPTGKYLGKGDLPLARALAQKDYHTKVFHSARAEHTAITKFLSLLPEIPAEKVYEILHPNRQSLIVPIQQTDEQFINAWVSYSYQGKFIDDNTPELYTSRGERVRSKSEIIIADSLNRESIPYRYECPLTLSGIGNVYPDFTVLNTRLRKELYWEHFGMMDDPVYVEKALQKIASYEQHGIFPGEHLIITYETRQTPINQKLVHLMIQHYLK